NGWAITAPSSIQWGGSLVEWAKGGGVYAEEVDGTNAIETYQATVPLVDQVRSGRGPVLLHLRLGLLDPHSSSTDIKAYRTNEVMVGIEQRDPDFFVYGEDVGSPRGGVVGATSMLVNQLAGRAISSHLNEQVIVGIAAGAGMVDGKARCAEIQFVDYHQSAAETIRMAARVSYQSYGDWSVPLIIRTKSGSGGGGPISSSTAGGGAFGHSNTGEQWFTNIPGMITICPATPFDAKGLMLEAARAQSPVTFLERGRLYRSEPPKDSHDNIIAAIAEYWNVPDGYYTLPLGKARRLRIGDGPTSIAIICWGTMVLEACTAAADTVNRVGGAIEVVDLRTLAPF